MLGKRFFGYIYLCISILTISCKENASLYFDFCHENVYTLHQFHGESNTAMTRVIFLLTIKMWGFFQSEEIFLDMFEDEYTQMIVSNFWTFFKRQNLKRFKFDIFISAYSQCLTLLSHFSKVCWGMQSQNYEIMKMNCKDNIGTWGRGGWTLTPTPRIFKFIKLS